MYGPDVAIFTRIWVSWYETHKVFRGLTMVNGTPGIGASVTPQTRGFVDYPSTRGIQVEVGLPDATFIKSGRVSFVQGALPKYKTCISCSKQCNIINIPNHMSNTATWAHKQYSICIPTMNPIIYPIVTRVTIFSLLNNTYIKLKEF